MITPLWTPGGVHELRVPKAGKHRTWSGYFDDIAEFTTEAARLDRLGVPGVYFTVNPVLPALLARSANTAVPYAESTTADRDIVRRRWLVVDLDPVRPANIPSTQHEWEVARQRGQKISWDLAGELDWPEPVCMDSGNGTYLLYRIDLPNDDPTRDLLHQTLEALHQRYSDDQVKVDTTMYNAARIIRVPGTTNRKGSGTPDRPHRSALLWEGMLYPMLVELPQLTTLAETVRQPEKAPVKAHTGGGALPGEPYDVQRVLRHLRVTRDSSYNGDGQRWEFDCPDNPEHRRNGWIIQDRAGKLYAGCNHDSCTWQWQYLRERYDPRPTRTDAPAPASTRTQPVRPGVGQAGPVDDPVENIEPTSTGAVQNGRHVLFPEVERIARSTRWIWGEGHSGWIPRGTLTLLAGREGGGKSTLLAWVTARLTRGDLPGVYHGQPRRVLYAATEDSWPETITPRLIAAGANLDLVRRVAVATEDGVTDRITLPVDVRGLVEGIRALGDPAVAALMLDPALSFIDDKISTNRAQELRTALEPLVRAAEDARMAVVGLVHFNKTQDTDLNSMIAGSRAWPEVARSVLACAWDDEADQYVLSQSKNSRNRKVQSISYTLQDTVVAGVDDDGQPDDIHVGRVLFGDTAGTDAEAVIQRRPNRGNQHRANSAADQILQLLAANLDRGWTPGQVADELGLPAGTARRVLHELRGRGTVRETHGLHWLADQ